MAMKRPRVLNTEKEDYHCHSLNFSDGMNTVDEVVLFAGKIGMKKIVFCDHSDATLKADDLAKKTFRIMTRRWKNVHNKVEVSFGIEADLLNEKGDICAVNQGEESDFVILSYHKESYSGDKKKVADGFVNAIARYKDKIKLIGHPFPVRGEFDAMRLVEAANKAGIPLELNCKYVVRSDDKFLDEMYKIVAAADAIYVNSDAHTLYELKETRKAGFDFLRKRKLI